MLVADLIAAGLVLEESGATEAENRSMGRPALPLALNRSVAYAIGADHRGPVDADGALSAEGIMPGWTGIRHGPELERRTAQTLAVMSGDEHAVAVTSTPPPNTGGNSAS